MKEVQEIEAIKYALRQSKDGTVVSFVIHPEDLDPALQCLPIGARVKLGWYAIGDDEKPVAAPSNGTTPNSDSGNVGSTPPAAAKPPAEGGTSKPLSQLCAIRCTDKKFQEWVAFNAEWKPEDAAEANVADWVRGMCRVKSRTELDTKPGAAQIWRSIEADFKAWLLDDRYPPEARGQR